MSLFTGTSYLAQPKGIVTNGLVFYVDATNLASYPGSGTAIYNLATINTTGSMFNGTTWEGNYWQFDGVNDFCQWPIGAGASSLDFGTGTATYMGTARYITTTTNGRTFAAGDNGTAEYVNWLLGHWLNSTENYYANGTVYGIPGGPNDTLWRVYTGTQNTVADSWGLWVNGKLIVQNTGGATGCKGINWCRYTPGTEHSDAQIANYLIYNRVLTTEEINQNYIALKDKLKFGV